MDFLDSLNTRRSLASNFCQIFFLLNFTAQVIPIAFLNQLATFKPFFSAFSANMSRLFDTNVFLRGAYNTCAHIFYLIKMKYVP